jgi:chloride channel protein, CIC family
MSVAALVGFVSGLGAVAFLEAIEAAEWLFGDLIGGRLLGGLPGWLVFLLPALGGLLVAPIVMRWVPEARGGGVPDVIISVETRRSRIRPRVAPGKLLASALTIGSGGSGGTEGPIVQIGASLGSGVGQALRLSEENTRLLLASGAAAGVAAVFNAPIAGVFFALEVILRRFNARNFSVVVLASVIGTVTAVAFRGDDPALSIPAYGVEQPFEIALYAVLGALAAIVAVGFTRGLYAAEGLARRQRLIPPLLLPATGGLLVGLLGLWHSGALGIGEAVTDAALLGDLAVETMLLLLGLKLATTILTLASGGSSGVFRPSLMMGAMLGGAFGIALEVVIPGDIAPPGAYATVGMAAMFAGAARAPITSILILFEMTRDYELMLPLMTAVVAATAVASLIDRLNIYTRRLHMIGIHIDEEPETENPMQSLRVRDAMGPVTVSLAPGTPLDEVAVAFAGERGVVAPVLDESGHAIGVVTDRDVNEALTDRHGELTAGDIASRPPRTIVADTSLHEALAALAGQSSASALLVVEREQPRVAVGILRRSDITNAYARAVEGRETARRRDRLRAAVDEDVRYLDYQVRRGSPADGRQLRDLPLTEDAVIVSVRHEGRTVIPRGRTHLAEGDRVTVIATAQAVDAVRSIFEG